MNATVHPLQRVHTALSLSPSLPIPIPPHPSPSLPSVLQTASASHTLSITANREALFKKADDSIVIEVSAMAVKMREIDEIQKKEEDFGMTVSCQSDLYIVRVIYVLSV